MTTEVDPNVYASRPWIKHYEAGVCPRLEYPEKTLPQFLTEGAAAHPDRPAVIFFDHVLTYGELERASARFAAALAGLGVRPGDRVGLLLPNMPQFVIGYFGILRAGATVVPFNPLYVESEVEHQLVDSGARVMLAMSKFFPVVQAVRERTALEHVVVTNIKEYFPPLLRILFTLAKERKEGHRVELPADGRTHRFQELLRAAPAEPPVVATSPDDIAVLQYTGGTTGTPKAAMLSHRNLIANLVQMHAWLAGSPKPARGYPVAMGVLPLFHTYGMATVMNNSILDGGAMVLVPRFEHLPVLRAIQKRRPNLFPGVPTLYNALNNFPGVEKFDLRSINACLSGAAALPVEVKKRFEALTGANLVEGYGLSETSPVTHCNPLHGLNKPGSIGVPFPDTDARIVDVDDGSRVLPPGQEGELTVRGPQVMQGYWNRHDETARVLCDGWFYTGDIAKMDDDGYFYIVDRKKDIIITGGINVYPRDVEEPLYAHPKVKEAIAVGVPDERWGEMVKVFVVLKEGQTATEQEIIDFCHGKMAGYKVPKAVEFRPELPKTIVGKPLRRLLRTSPLAPSPQSGEGG